jgi:hypothetical protein
MASRKKCTGGQYSHIQNSQIIINDGLHMNI